MAVAARLSRRRDHVEGTAAHRETHNGQSALEQAAAQERTQLPVIELIELLVFQSAG